ncbi:GalNAc-alpha-(1-_4)-GalNAc-alpha-(1-_3)-diNAcBac-PP-undecaprenol alpha-1,4-N-acetyl-D-galactosaminyltransferase [Kordia antarctica]|uniref:GalNAc-alpha-(1->4)-GalNAc-alpha-(1->3)-diNAcBac-PP-undecaprenol alpha-1,4-N-acetyl-D-galactosaminyltransferase n=1 Tax=Kordia antarctica TaxID=1218801 RepID=A0A7L4ZIU8_9FLAO|nr:glycosyltransferase family 4 protein [Kordia antarctica]QHI36349.1 GalNAc-alpha-(1->4)-GalNAc-alpha-(1->3)-diNAcBac-PP-undecaprenol alpha-1,4-N-acetyl-D-galactosaminyltransferase [Kordia antarctica]
MLQNSKKKICIIVDCLSGGGAEKQAANFSKSLYKEGFEVSIISLKDQITYDYKGTLYNLGENESSIKISKQFQKFFAFKKAYETCNADMYIDFRTRSRFVLEYLLHKFIFEAEKMIMIVHSYHIQWHIPKGKLFKKIYNELHAVVGVSEAIEEKLGIEYDFENLLHIPNYIIETETETTSETTEDYIIAVGRLQNDIKQFDRLIETYKASNLAEKNIKLFICGDGEDKESLEKLISTLQLEVDVKLLGFVENVAEYIRNAKFLVLSSKVEGFPMVLLEALQQKTPVIAFDCKSGPSEIIQHKINGLLVEDQNFAELKDAMLLLIENSALYANCKQNTVSSILKFTEKPVIQQWIQLINI